MWSFLCFFTSLVAASVSYNGLPFSEQDFTLAAALTQMTYCSLPNQTDPGLKVGNATLLKSISYGQDEQRVNIYHDQNSGIIVAYEGTNASVMADWAQDFNVSTTEISDVLGLSKKAKIVSGLSKQFNLSWKNVKLALENITSTYPNASILVTGHSMGGGLCQLGALAIEKNIKRVDKAIAFAPLRAGNAAFAREFDEIFKTGKISRYTGVTNGNDWVPYGMVPASLGFKHPSGMVWIYPESGSNYYYFDDAESTQGPAGQKIQYYTMETLVSGAEQVIDAISTGKNLNEFDFDFFNIFNWAPHEGIYMKTKISAATGNCLPSLDTI